MKTKKLCIIVSIVIMVSVFTTTLGMAHAEEPKIMDTLIGVEHFTASDSGAIVEFDKAQTISEMYTHLLENNMNMSNEKAYEIAVQLAEQIEIVENSLKDMVESRAASTRVIIQLGRVVNNDFLASEDADDDTPETRQYVPDSRTTIISEGWSVNPYTKTSKKYAKHPTSWEGLDLYKSNLSGKYYQNRTTSTSVSVGYANTFELSAAEAAKVGLRVTASGTATSSIQKGFEMNVPAWHKMMVRPYVYYIIDDYQGTYRYYCYNNYSKEYFYVNETRTAKNTYNIEKGHRVWDKYNSAHNPNAVSPTPPAAWEW